MSDRQDDASEAMREAFANAEQVAMLLDRHWGDSGDDADMIHDWRATLESLVYDIRKALGEPRMKLPGGGLVPRPRT
ncbi:hypothetical protein UFOVP735_43 [uncultured Caudovirales phage]|uniref:Uncharacterized protein n=1 Tax=uncultured Caudovirales phage TaxID=2100421 RepID=A0A6J7X1C6_9CAUD|nr:hypothetical protein UFOVP735_43 [uncultured Caudovirales phage]